MFICKEIKAQAIQLTWDSNPELDIKYYGIYKDVSDNPEIEITKVYTPDTTYLDRDIVPGQGYYYRITAIDSADNISEFSDGIYIVADDPTPVELVFFSAEVIDNKVILKWRTTTESNNFGFEIQKSTDRVNFDKIDFVHGLGTSTRSHSYNFVDKNIPSGNYYYRLKQIDTDGSFEFSDIITAEIDLPQAFELSQNYPNPFNPETTIKYSIAKSGKVSLIIYDLLGREIKRLVDGHQDAGYYAVKWDGKDNIAELIPSGIYFIRLQTEEYFAAKKMSLMK